MESRHCVSQLNYGDCIHTAICTELCCNRNLCVRTFPAKTQLGVWLIEDLHGVTCTVAGLTHQALLYLSVYPLIDVVVRLLIMFFPPNILSLSLFAFVVMVSWWCVVTMAT